MSFVRRTAIFVAILSGHAGALDVPLPDGSDFAPAWETVGFSHDLWDRVLSDHVDDEGLVDYAALQENDPFREYIYRLANTNPAEVGGNTERLAFWINVYNALAIQGVLVTLPDDRSTWGAYSVLNVSVPGIEEKGKGFFQGLRFVVGGRRLTLDEIEKAVMLQQPDWVARERRHYRSVGPKTPDPRVHFALVCAAKGCVKLRRGAYQGAALDTQLAEAVRRFVNDPTQARFDTKNRIMHVSRLLEWYGDDLTDPRYSPHGKSVAEFLSRYVDEGVLARSLGSQEWRTVYLEYDWQLNLRR